MVNWLLASLDSNPVFRSPGYFKNELIDVLIFLEEIQFKVFPLLGRSGLFVFLRVARTRFFFTGSGTPSQKKTDPDRKISGENFQDLFPTTGSWILRSWSNFLHHRVDADISTSSISVDVQGSIGHGCYSLHVGGHRRPPCCAKNFYRKR